MSGNREGLDGAPRRAVALVVILALAGCSVNPVRERTAAVPPPPELLTAGQLQLPADCPAVPGAVYRAGYVVDGSGAVDEVDAHEGPPCVRAALSSWIHSFRYAPGSAPANSTIDWMVTVARR